MEITQDQSPSSHNSVSHFRENSGAYPFTNEPLSDISSEVLNLNGNALVITSAGDIQILIGGLGAKSIDSLDASRKSNAWAEYKWQIFQNYSESQYRNTLIENPTWGNFPRDLPVSNPSRDLFSVHRGGNDECIYASDIFKQVKFHGLKIDSTGYWGENYERFKKRLKNACLRFHLGALENILRMAGLNKKFSFVYLSNVLDHNLDKEGESL